jgi:glycosyltransferase involved in cell wall biosynthesis
MAKPTIYVLSPDLRSAAGGVKQLYRHVDILNDHGFQASLVHQQKGFRNTWFENRTRITSIPELQSIGKPDTRDFLLVPEVFWPAVMNSTHGLRKVIFNQNAFWTLKGIPIEHEGIEETYLHKEILAVLSVSDHNMEYLSFAFPDVQIHRVHYGFDPSLFRYSQPKKLQIAVMPRKNFEDIVQVVNLLKIRRSIPDFDWAIIKNMPESEVARTLRESQIFLSFGTEEGCPMPPTEAMACGCIVIGYDGWGGREYFKPEFSYPIQTGDILKFATTIESVAKLCRRDPASVTEMGATAARYVRDHYSMERERQDVIQFWTALTQQHLESSAPRGCPCQ